MRRKETGLLVNGDLPLTIDLKWFYSRELRTTVLGNVLWEDPGGNAEIPRWGSECGSGQVTSCFIVVASQL